MLRTYTILLRNVSVLAFKVLKTIVILHYYNIIKKKELRCARLKL